MADYKPQPKQYDMLETLTADNGIKYLLYGGAAGGGKTYGGVAWLIIMALQHDGSSYFIARKKRSDLKESTFITFKTISRAWGVDDKWNFNGQDNVIEFDNGSRISLIAVAYQPQDFGTISAFSSKLSSPIDEAELRLLIDSGKKLM